jgi:hypothetical protein
MSIMPVSTIAIGPFAMRPIRYSINVTLDGCCDHRAILPDEDLHRHAVENLNRADALLFGRVTYEMREAAFRPPAGTVARPEAEVQAAGRLGRNRCGSGQSASIQRRPET